MHRLVQILAFVVSAFLLAACSSATDEHASSHDHDHDHDHDHGSAETSSDGVVRWPELRTVDDLTHRLKATSESGTLEEVLSLTEEWVAAVDALVSGDLPDNVANAEQVDVFRGDLESLARLSSTAKAIPEEKLRKMVGGFQEPVHNLMEAAGMAHLHSVDDHAEDHSDHDH